jgi:hypothetical protein
MPCKQNYIHSHTVEDGLSCRWMRILPPAPHSRMNYRPRIPRNHKENQASALIHCRVEFAFFVQHGLPPRSLALTEEVTTLERSDGRTQDSSIRDLSWGRISGSWIGALLQVVIGRMPCWVCLPKKELLLDPQGPPICFPSPKRATKAAIRRVHQSVSGPSPASPVTYTAASSLFPNLVSGEEPFSSSHRVLCIIFIINAMLMHSSLLQTIYFLQFLTKNWREL